MKTNANRGSELIPGYRYRQRSDFKDRRVTNVLTLTPSSAKPGETLYIDLPKMSRSDCLVTDSVYLIYDIVVSGTKSYFMNNISKSLQRELKVEAGAKVVYDCTGESIFQTYADLWLSDDVRNTMVEEGLANENLRKLMSGDDSGNSSGNDKVIHDIIGNTVRMKISKVIEGHGPISPSYLRNNIRYHIQLPRSDKVLLAQSGETIGEYSLENLRLEYQLIRNERIAKQIATIYEDGFSMAYDHIVLFKNNPWGKDTTIINESVNLPRNSMKAIVLLFTDTSITDTEKFVYPNITNVDVSIDGVPNSIYPKGINKRRFYNEASRLFMFNSDSQSMNVESFYKDKFALVVDLRTHEGDSFGNGINIRDSQSGILMEISKETTTNDLMCHIFVVSDALLTYERSDVMKVDY